MDSLHYFVCSIISIFVLCFSSLSSAAIPTLMPDSTRLQNQNLTSISTSAPPAVPGTYNMNIWTFRDMWFPKGATGYEAARYISAGTFSPWQGWWAFSVGTISSGAGLASRIISVNVLLTEGQSYPVVKIITENGRTTAVCSGNITVNTANFGPLEDNSKHFIDCCSTSSSWYYLSAGSGSYQTAGNIVVDRSCVYDNSQ